MTRRAVEQVVIVGCDAAAWLTALALRRAFRANLSVRVIETASLLSDADVYAATPSLGALHQLLGLQEREVLAAAAGLPVLGQRFANWGRSRPAFVHGYDAQRAAINDIDFLQFWTKARSEGLRVDLEDFSLGASAAKQGRSTYSEDGVPRATPISAGYHLDAHKYVDLLRRRAMHAGVQATFGRVREVRRRSYRIDAVILEDGRSVGGDLFVDASGSEAVLIGGMDGRFDSWSNWFRADRILTASARPLKPLPAFSQITAFKAGWLGLHPLQDRTGIVAVYDSKTMGDRDVVAALSVLTGLQPQGEASVAPFAAGLRPAWQGNCLALGDAAVSLEPLDAIQLHLIHIGISNLIAMFPVEAESMPEADIYNAAMTSHISNVRDFQLAHYALNERFDEAFWDRAREAELPPRLRSKLSLFRARGVVPMSDDESFQEQNWTSILVGHGLIPGNYDPLVDAVPIEEQMGKFRGLLAQIAEEVRELPSLDAQFGGAGA